ncbi:MAG: hypothetical protein JWP57_1895, partial [Spirosoma sp.]|nr:hypothetical protein [Spirosoma sp.]
MLNGSTFRSIFQCLNRVLRFKRVWVWLGLTGLCPLMILAQGTTLPTGTSSSPTILQQPPAALTVLESQAAIATLTATGVASYKWLKMDEKFAVEVDGQTTATLSLTNLQRYQAGRYICRLSGQNGTLIYSDTVRLTVTPLPIVYIAGFGAGQKNGSSWTNALPGNALQSYLATAQPGQQIWVLEGLYKPTYGTNRNVSFTIPQGVQLYGGFRGNETAIDQRPPITHYKRSRSILSGEIDNNPDNDNHGDNDSYHVVTISSFTDSEIEPIVETRLDGFQISGGKATGMDEQMPGNNYGGGVYLTTQYLYYKFTIANCYFDNNKADYGGGLFIGTQHGQTPKLVNCSFSRCTAKKGGAMYIFHLAPFFRLGIELTNCVFVENGAEAGSAMYCNGVETSLLNCSLIFNNTSEQKGGAIYSITTPYGGSYESTTRLTNCLLWGNSSNLVEYSLSGTHSTITYSNIQDSLYLGAGNLRVNPQFVSDNNGDFRLLPGSPLINAGDPSSSLTTLGQKDAAGQPRVVNGRVDIGAFEYQLPPAPTLTGVSITPDAVCPGQVITLTATVGNVSSPYAFTLTNGSQNISGITAGSTFSQALTVSEAAPGGPQNYTLLVASDGQIGSATATVMVRACNIGTANPLDSFTITGVTMVSCAILSAGQRQIQFIPRYAGLSGQPISFSVVNEMLPTTAPGPYTLRLYTDNPAITLRARQTGTPPPASFVYNWLAACNGTNPAPDNTPPRVVNTIGPQTASVGQAFTYLIPASTFTDDQTPNSIGLTVSGLPAGLVFTPPATISGTPSQTGVSTVTVRATDPGTLSASTSFTITVSPSSTSGTAPFSFTRVTTVGCQTLSTGLRSVRFTPQYGGLTGQPISFSVVNEMLPTTNAGPYTLNLYTDNPAITLSARQGSSVVTYRYNWLGACQASARQGLLEGDEGLQVVVLGNPVEANQVVVEVRGAQRQALHYVLRDAKGYGLAEHAVKQAGSVERQTL